MPVTIPVALIYLAIAIIAGVLAYRATWTAAASLAATAPFAWYHALGPTLFTVSKAAFIGAFAGLLLAAVLRAQVRADVARVFRGDVAPVALVAFALLALVSIAWSAGRADAVRDSFKWLWYAGAFCITAVSVRSTADAMRVATVLFISSSVVGLDGLWQSFTGAPDVPKPRTARSFRASRRRLRARINSART